MDIQYSNEELVALIQDGEADRIEQLWIQVEAFIKQQANRWTVYAEFEDLCQQAYFILLESAKSYNSQSGAKFITWLGNRLSWGWQRWISDSMLVFHLPAHMAMRLLQYDRACKEWAAKTGRQPTAAQLCYLMECSRSELQTVKDTIRRMSVRSLQERIGEDGKTELQELIADDKDFTEDILDDVQRGQLSAILWSLVDDLDERQGAVLRARYEKGRTLDETGAALGISRERVRQLEAKALQKLRRPKPKKQLQAFYDMAYCKAMQGTGVGSFMRTWTSATEREALQSYAYMDKVQSASTRTEEPAQKTNTAAEAILQDMRA